MADINYDSALIDRRAVEKYPAAVLASALAAKIGRRLRNPLRPARDAERTVSYNGVTVFDRLDLHGEGMTVGQDYMRALNSLGLRPVDRLFEFCAGPGYIGYSLLANGFCKHLVLADINPVAVEVARKTARMNRLEDKVTVYRSDVFDAIPQSERWDLVVSNPPHFLPQTTDHTDIKAFDPGWQIHRRFYAGVKAHMNPGGLVVMQENARGVPKDLTPPMIIEGGGRHLATVDGVDVTGRSNHMYYVVSEW